MALDINWSGPWFKGNLHTHTTESDGVLTPQQTVDGYAEHGYDFLALTDHWKLTDPASVDNKGLLLIPGSELNGGQAELGQDYHIVALGLREPVKYAEDMTAQEIINAALAAGELCFIAHPSWSSLAAGDIMGLRGHIGIEVYNTTCHRGIGRGESSVQWNEMLARGLRPLALAVDDAHMHCPDGFGGFVMVQAPERTQEAILTAVQQGRFYSSMGPQITNIELVDNKVHVACSAAVEISLISPFPGCGRSTYLLGVPGPFTEAEFSLQPSFKVCRVEVTDERGRKAWSNTFEVEQ